MLILKKELLKSIILHAKEEYPNEACGILAGEETPEKIYQMTNTQKSPSLYFMDPKEQFGAMKDMRRAGHKMVAIYHSHVASQPYPSAHDVEMAFYPEVSYVILSLKDIENPLVRSFKIKDGKITEEQVKII